MSADAPSECRAIRSEIAEADRLHALRGMRELNRIAERFFTNLPEEMRQPFAEVIFAARDGIKEFDVSPRPSEYQRRKSFRAWCVRFAGQIRDARRGVIGEQ